MVGVDGFHVDAFYVGGFCVAGFRTDGSPVDIFRLLSPHRGWLSCKCIARVRIGPTPLTYKALLRYDSPPLYEALLRYDSPNIYINIPPTSARRVRLSIVGMAMRDSLGVMSEVEKIIELGHQWKSS